MLWSAAYQPKQWLGVATMPSFGRCAVAIEEHDRSWRG